MTKYYESATWKATTASFYTEEEAKQGHQEIEWKLRNGEFQFIIEVYRLVIT